MVPRVGVATARQHTLDDAESLLDDLLAFLDAGGRKIDLWFARHRVVQADFRDAPEAFANVNDSEERTAIERRLAGGAA